jgi:hypothetical protein
VGSSGFTPVAVRIKALNRPPENEDADGVMIGGRAQRGGPDEDGLWMTVAGRPGLWTTTPERRAMEAPLLCSARSGTEQ